MNAHPDQASDQRANGLATDATLIEVICRKGGYDPFFSPVLTAESSRLCKYDTSESKSKASCSSICQMIFGA
jgi:hypothetical protein